MLSILAASTGPPVRRVYGDAAAVALEVDVAGVVADADDADADGLLGLAVGVGVEEQPARAATAHPARPASPTVTARRGGW